MMKQGMTPVIAGLGLGVVGAAVVSRTLSGLLFEVDVTNLTTYVAGALLLGGAAFGASFLPAERATRIDPAAALRAE